MLGESTAQRPERVALPLEGWPAGWGVSKLMRRFQEPTIDARSETLVLRLEAVPGVVEMVLDGEKLPIQIDADLPLAIDPEKPCRHTLELMVDPAVIARVGAGGIWGEIALVVQSRQEALGGRGEGL